jgi:CheY-like chemotaxis protein
MRVLLVESNPADAYIMVDALKQAGLKDGVTVVDDSTLALERLKQETPDLVLLDLSVTPLSGLEVLAEMRQDPKLESVPVVVVSGSENKSDVQKAYQLHANCYINKPGRLDDFLRFMKTCYEFWGTVVTLPPR